MVYFISIFFPFVGLFMVRKPISAYFNLISHLLILLGSSLYPTPFLIFPLWIIIVLWSFFEINDFKTRKSVSKLSNAVKALVEGNDNSIIEHSKHQRLEDVNRFIDTRSIELKNSGNRKDSLDGLNDDQLFNRYRSFHNEERDYLGGTQNKLNNNGRMSEKALKQNKYFVNKKNIPQSVINENNINLALPTNSYLRSNVSQNPNHDFQKEQLEVNSRNSQQSNNIKNSRANNNPAYNISSGRLYSDYAHRATPRIR